MRALLLIVLLALAAGCASPGNNNATTSTPSGTTTTPTVTTPTSPTSTPPADCAPQPQAPCATFTTSLGNFTATLYADKAPLSVANFLQDAQDGLYDNTVFHRVVKGFVIQGGGFAAPFNASARPRTQSDGPIPTEIWSGNHHAEGTLGMARTQDPNSGTNQWFVNTADNGRALDSGYTVFGNVTSGLDVVHAIENVTVATKGQYQSVPTTDVVIQSVRVAVAPAPAKPELKAYHATLDVAPGGEASTPLFVRNAGGDRLNVSLVGSAENGATVDFPRVPGLLSSGQAGVAILHVKTPDGYTGGGLDVTATGPGGNATVHLELKPLNVTGNASGPDHGAVQTYYLGLFDNGVTFDTTMTNLQGQGFPMPAGFQQHPQALKVWVGAGSPMSGYTPVIPGFASGIVGLHAGETRTVRLTSDEGYKDGYFRLFEMTVKSVDS
ncbi:MAG: peptidyl-prolyl cis-trans isomerase [Thermoplasmata archaeon]|jgi:cyclophilin family peptidyl-prolyl cis-trans isomerase|nr:peptidyl-prolyl cis-trans isomerase [Thermoplasmata archaeon]